MLVLTRRPQEVIAVDLPGGRLLEIRVVDICGNSRVRIGIEAPSGYHVWRPEFRGLKPTARVASYTNDCPAISYAEAHGLQRKNHKRPGAAHHPSQPGGEAAQSPK